MRTCSSCGVDLSSTSRTINGECPKCYNFRPGEPIHFTAGHLTNCIDEFANVVPEKREYVAKLLCLFLYHAETHPSTPVPRPSSKPADPA